MCHPKSPAHPLILLCSLILGVWKILSKLFLKMNVAFERKVTCVVVWVKFSVRWLIFLWHITCNYTFVCWLVYLRSVLPPRLGKFQEVRDLICFIHRGIPIPRKGLAYIKDSISTGIRADKDVFGSPIVCPVSCMRRHCCNSGKDTIFAF